MFYVLVFLSIFLLALSAGAAATHLMEIPGKRRLPSETVFAVHGQLYIGYRVSGLVIEAATLVALIVAAVVSSGEGTSFSLVIAALAVDLAAVGVFVGWTDQRNKEIAKIGSGATRPGDYLRLLASWEASHGLRAVLFLTAIGLLLSALATH